MKYATVEKIFNLADEVEETCSCVIHRGFYQTPRKFVLIINNRYGEIVYKRVLDPNDDDFNEELGYIYSDLNRLKKPLMWSQ